MGYFKGKAITLHRPWDVAVVFAGKDIENRSWSTSHRGPLAIHSGQYWNKEGAAYIKAVLGLSSAILVCEKALNTAGHIIGICEITDCLNFDSDEAAYEDFAAFSKMVMNKWAFGPYCWLLRDIRPIRPVRMRGWQRLWNTEFEYELL